MSNRCEDYPCCGHTDGLGCNYTPDMEFITEHAMCDHESGICEAHDDGEPEGCEYDDPTNPSHDGWSWNSKGEAECDWCGIRLPQHDGDYDGAPIEQWEVTEPPEVYMTDYWGDGIYDSEEVYLNR